MRFKIGDKVRLQNGAVGQIAKLNEGGDCALVSTTPEATLLQIPLADLERADSASPEGDRRD